MNYEVDKMIIAPNAYLWYERETLSEAEKACRPLYRKVNRHLDDTEYYIKQHPLIHPIVARDFIMSIGAFNPDLKAQEDLDCYLRLILHGGRVKFIMDMLWYYRIRKQSLSNQQSKLNLMENELSIYQNFYEQCTNPLWKRIAADQIRLLKLGRSYHALVAKLRQLTLPT